MKTFKIFIIAGGLTAIAGNYAWAQSLNPQDMGVFGGTSLPVNLQNEEAEFAEALKAVQTDFLNTELLEQFINRHPSTRHTATAILEYERAMILAAGTYELPFATPDFSNFKPTEQPYQFFYESQKELMGEKPDYAKLRNRYEQLLTMNDPAYFDESNYYLGYLDYAEGKYDDALNRFNSLPDDSKYYETTQFYLMQIDYAKGNYEHVLQSLEHPFFGNLHGEKAAEIGRIKAECLTRVGKKQEALEYYQKYLNETENPIATSAYNCAVLAYEAGDNKLAQQAAIKAATGTDPRMQQYSYMLLGQSYMLSGETPKAKMAFDRAAAMTADREVQEAASYNKLVLTHETAYSPWGDEVVEMENFLNTFPNSKYSDNVSTYLTEVYLTTKNYEAALASIRKIKNPNQTILDAKHNLLYQCGIQEFVNGDYVQANNHFTECIDINVSNQQLLSPAHYWRGESRYHLDFLSEAADDYKEAARLATDNHIRALSNYSLGYVNFKDQNFSDASACFESFAANPAEHNTETYFDALARLGDCAYYNRDFMKAETYYSTVADSESNSTPYALFQQAFMAGLQKKYSEKQNTLDRLIARYPASDYIDVAWLEKGNTSILQNQTGAAINAFKYVVDNYPYSPSAPTAAVQLAMAYNSNGQTAEAQKIYEMVAQKYPNTDEAATALQDLKTLSTNALYADMPVALANGDYQKVIDNFEKLSNENVDFRDLQKMQLMTAKAHFAQGNDAAAMQLLETCAKDMRTEAGSEAKFMIAQRLYDNNQAEEALAQATELIQAGTQHQYWLARAIILMSDISILNDDSFTATEYLKSLKENYTENDDIQTMIEERLEKMNNNN